MRSRTVFFLLVQKVGVTHREQFPVRCDVPDRSQRRIAERLALSEERTDVVARSINRLFLCSTHWRPALQIARYAQRSMLNASLVPAMFYRHSQRIGSLP